MDAYVLIYRDVDGEKHIDSIYTDKVRAEATYRELMKAEEKYRSNERVYYRIQEMPIDTTRGS